jgi:hypothetical protein
MTVLRSDDLTRFMMDGKGKLTSPQLVRDSQGLEKWPEVMEYGEERGLIDDALSLGTPW